jgi:hypothetical protein
MNQHSGYFVQTPNCIEVDFGMVQTMKDRQVNQYGDDTVLTYFAVDYKKLTHLVFRDFCKIPPTYVVYAEILGGSLLSPHKDHNVYASLNYYVSAGQDETIFFEKKDKNIKGYPASGQTMDNIFKIEDLDEITSFIANTNETYLLNVEKIHCVKKFSTQVRSFIAFQWCHNTYNEVLENLII